MKTTPVLLCVITLAASVFLPASLPRAHADDESDRADLVDLLTAGSWKVTYEKGWSIVRVFDKGGTFATPNRPDESGRWKIAGKMVVQTFTDGRKDIFSLPLAAQGTAGIGKDGETLNAVHDTAAAPPVPTPAQEMDEHDREVAAQVLVSAPWKITAGTWYTVRVFDRSGTFTTAGGSERGRWKIADGMVTLTFTDGHKDFLILPLDTKGTAAALETGQPATAVTQYVSPLDTGAPVPAPMVSNIAIANNGPMDEDEKAASIALLVSGPWKITGGGWTNIRIFDKNGKFTTLGSADSSGRWRISNNSIVLTFAADGHKNTISLPLNPKGTAGADQNGGATTAVLMAPAGAPAISSAPIALAPVPTAAPAVPHPAPSAPVVISDPQGKEATVAVLTSGSWNLATKTWNDVRVFMKDGTFKTLNRTDEDGHWTMTSDLIILSFPNGHKDAMTLPLNPKGTTGMADDGSAMNAVQLSPAAGNSPPAPPASSAPFGTYKQD